MYWTTEDLKPGDLHAEGNNSYSKETVLSYRYDPSTSQYYVIENRAFVNQIGRDWQRNHNALAQAPSEYGKPPANVSGPFSTYEDAKKRYEEVKAEHGGKYIY